MYESLIGWEFDDEVRKRAALKAVLAKTVPEELVLASLALMDYR